MPPSKKLSILFALSLALAGGLLLVLTRRPEPPKVKVQPPSAPGPPETGRPGPETAEKPEGPPPPGPTTPHTGPALAGKGWIITGRVVRKGERATVVAAEGAAVRLGPEPGWTRPEDTLQAQHTITGPDGRFELAGVPSDTRLRMEIDDPRSALMKVTLQLSDRDGRGRWDLGDIALERPATLIVRLIGPQNEPLEKGKVIVGGDVEREAEDRGAGEYVLERVPPGEHVVEVTVPGYAGVLEWVELPRGEPLVIRLVEGPRIAGAVRAPDGTPVENAVVWLSREGGPEDPNQLTDFTTKTNGSGRFVFDSLTGGLYTIWVEARGFAGLTAEEIRSGTEDLELILVPGAVFAGRVIDETDSQPVPGARVNLVDVDVDTDAQFGGETSAQGFFETRDIPPGTYMVKVYHDDFGDQTEGLIEIKAGERIADEVIRLKRGLSVTVKVIDAETGAPIPGASVSFSLETEPLEEGLYEAGETNADGVVELKRLKEGGYCVERRGPEGYIAATEMVSLTPGGEREFTMSLRRVGSGSISGRVLDSDGRPVPGAVVKPRLSFSPGTERIDGLDVVMSLKAETDSAGRYRIEWLPPHGACAVLATHDDYLPGLVKGIVVGPHEAVEGVDIILGRGGTISGRVVDEKGNTIPNAVISAEQEERELSEEEVRFSFRYTQNSRWSVSSDGEGNFTVPRLEPGIYRLEASLEEGDWYRSGTREEIEVIEGRTTETIDIILGTPEKGPDLCTLSGRVVDISGNGIAGVYIFAVKGGFDQTDIQGRFHMEGLRAGEVKVCAWKEGFGALEIRAVVPGDPVSITLERVGIISGTVRVKGYETVFFSRGPPEPQVGAIGRRRDGNAEEAWGQLASDGGFRIGVPAGTYVLRAEVCGFAPGESEEITLEAGEMREGVAIELAEGGTIKGVVVASSTGEPICEAKVSLCRPTHDPEETPALSWTFTLFDGRFTLEHVPEGTLDLVASHARYDRGSVRGISILTGQTIEVRIELGPGGGIRGAVSREGTPVAGAAVTAWKGAHVREAGGDARTDSRGRYEIKDLGPGEYEVSASIRDPAGALLRIERTAMVTGGRFTELDLGLGPCPRLVGCVTRDGQPVANIEITAERARKGFLSRAATDAAGAYALDLPGAGTYLVTVGQKRVRAVLEVTVPESVTELRHDIELP